MSPFRASLITRPRRSVSTTLPIPAAPATPSTPSPADGATDIAYDLLTWVSARATKFDVYQGLSVGAVSYVAAVLKDAPIGYWRLGENSGSVFADSSGGGFSATVAGGVTLGQAGALADMTLAAQFDGLSGFASRAAYDPLNGLTAVTLEAWINHNGNAWSATYEAALDFAANNQFLSVLNGVNNPGLKISGTLTQVNGGAVPTTGWHHLVVTWTSGGKILSYLDGVQVATSPTTLAGSLDPSNFMMFASFSGPAFFFNGSLDEIAIYNYNLSPTQVANHYAQRLGSAPVGIHVTSPSFVPAVLPSTTYFWQVVAINDGGMAVGPVWSFTTPSAKEFFVTLAGALTTRVLAGTVAIRDVLGATANTATATFDTTAPTDGEAVQIGIGGLDTAKIIFAGEIQSQNQTYAEHPDNERWPGALIDWTFRLNKRRPFGTFQNVSATAIVQSLIASFAPAFSTNHVQLGLPAIAIVFDGSQDFSACLQAIAAAINGYYRVDYSKDIHLFLAETTDVPDPIDLNHLPLNNPPFTFSTDFSQLRTRDYVRGAGVSVPCDVAIGETILPIANAAIFGPSGGQAAIGGQVVSYVGLQAGGGGSLVGPGAAPSTAPTLALGAGAGLSPGVYEYAYTDLTPAGESLPSPLGTVTTVDISGPVSPPIVNNALNGNLGTDFAVGDTLQYEVTYSSAVGIADLSQETVPSPASGAITVIVSGTPPFPNAPAISIPASLDARTTWIRLWRSKNGGGFFLIGSHANVAWSPFDNLTTGGFAHPIGAGSNTYLQITVSAVAIGPATVTARKIYRTAVNGAQLKLLTTLADNTTLAFTDTIADGSLGANAPVGDTSGLTQPTGQVNAGSPSLLTASAGPFLLNGGWVLLGGGQVVRYTGITGNTLTGIPVNGPGSITTTVIYGSQVLPSPALTGINTWNGLTLPILNGSTVAIFVQRDDLAAQAALGLLELDENGNPTDGIHEFEITDTSLTSVTLCNARGDADLAIFSRPIISIAYDTYDTKTRSGKTVHVNLPAPTSLVGDFVIQDVTITWDGPELPHYSVKASSVKFALEDLLRRVLVN